MKIETVLSPAMVLLEVMIVFAVVIGALSLHALSVGGPQRGSWSPPCSGWRTTALVTPSLRWLTSDGTHQYATYIGLWETSTPFPRNNSRFWHLTCTVQLSFGGSSTGLIAMQDKMLSGDSSVAQLSTVLRAVFRWGPSQATLGSFAAPTGGMAAPTPPHIPELHRGYPAPGSGLQVSSPPGRHAVASSTGHLNQEYTDLASLKPSESYLQLGARLTRFAARAGGSAPVATSRQFARTTYAL